MQNFDLTAKKETFLMKQKKRLSDKSDKNSRENRKKIKKDFCGQTVKVRLLNAIDFKRINAGFADFSTEEELRCFQGEEEEQREP